MDITEERKKKVDFTQKYQHIPARFAAKKGTEIQLDKAFMDGKTIAVQRATSMDTYITDNFPMPPSSAMAPRMRPIST